MLKNFDIFLIFARRGGSNEYPQSMFWSKNKKNRYTHAYPSFAIKSGVQGGYTLHGHVFMMEPSTRAPLVYVYNLVFKIVIVSNMPVDFVCLFELKLYAPVNSYCYVGTLPPFYRTFTQNLDIMTSKKFFKYNQPSRGGGGYSHI